MAYNFTDATLLGYQVNKNYLGEGVFALSTIKNISIEGILDNRVTNADSEGVKENFQKISGFLTGIVNAYDAVIVNGYNLGTGKVSNLSFPDQNPIRLGSYKYDIEIIENSDFSNIQTGDIYGTFISGVNDKILSLDETLNFDNVANGDYSYNHDLNIQYYDTGSDLFTKSKNFANSVYSDSLKLGLIGPFSGFYDVLKTKKNYFSETYDLISKRCGFSKKILINKNYNNNYTTTLNHTITLDANGKISVTEQGVIKGLDNTLNYTADNYFNTELANSYNRCQNIYNTYVEKYGLTPETPPALGCYTKISDGSNHSLGLLKDGRVTGWGSNTYGQTTIPIQIQQNITGISAGGRHSLALLKNGTVTGWGDNSFGQTTIPLGIGANATGVSAGLYHSLSILQDGRVTGWGDNSFGQITIPAGIGTNAANISAGNWHSLALLKDGRVTGWGQNTSNQISIPAGIGTNAIEVSAGFFYSLALLKDGSVTGWGANTYGQITVPQIIQGNVTGIDLGGSHSLALLKDGSVTGWGDNSLGQITIPAGIGTNAANISAGYDHSLVLLKDGRITGWGNNSSFQTSSIPSCSIGGTSLNGTGDLLFNQPFNLGKTADWFNNILEYSVSYVNDPAFEGNVINTYNITVNKDIQEIGVYTEQGEIIQVGQVNDINNLSVIKTKYQAAKTRASTDYPTYKLRNSSFSAGTLNSNSTSTYNNNFSYSIEKTNDNSILEGDPYYKSLSMKIDDQSPTNMYKEYIIANKNPKNVLFLFGNQVEIGNRSVNINGTLVRPTGNFWAAPIAFPLTDLKSKSISGALNLISNDAYIDNINYNYDSDNNFSFNLSVKYLDKVV